MTRMQRKFYRTLVKAHRLAWREKRLCRRLISVYGLDEGAAVSSSVSSPVSSSPLSIFFRPSFWETFARDAQDGRDRLDAGGIRALAAKLFALPPPPNQKKPELAALALVEDGLPREW